jgi:hypothetical protein
MTRVLSLDGVGVAPSRIVTLQTQGIPEGHDVPDRVITLADEARALYESLVHPRGVLAEISKAEFGEVYLGEGRNEEPTPLPRIIDQADHLALFAATLGEPLCQKINELFRTNDPAMGSMLDGIASQRADSAATLLGTLFLESLVEEGRADADTRVLPYSPGYCGWHVSGQRKLFAYLDPGLIDIELNESCLMSPLKSVSGVLVTGPAQIHDFDNDFEFCLDCATWDCRERIASLT